MWAKPTKEMLANVPELYATEDTPLKDKVIHLHFFLGGCDWYIAEYDGQDTMFGYCVLNNDLEMAEWGYVSFTELKNLKVGFMEVDTDLHFGTPKACEVDTICKGMRW